MKKLEQVLQDWEAVIGLEIHTELTTLTTKMFCGCKLEFGAAPNTHTCPVCLGLPGALPVPNKAAIESIVLAGLATNCDIEKHSMFYRKNYMYPDMAKNFQTTQGPVAFCMRGHLDLDVDGPAAKERTDIAGLGAGETYENGTVTDTGYTAHVGITRIHMEEDAGKMVHIGGDEGRIAGATHSLVDYNRAGTPLIELVTEPDLRTPEEARLFMQKLRQIFLAIGISDCSMEEGSMRCDGNVSLRRRGSTKLGVKTELKNMNSFKNLHDGLAYEICRQAEVLEEGGQIYQETRHWDPTMKHTIVMRVKETADDYRLFPIRRPRASPSSSACRHTTPVSWWKASRPQAFSRSAWKLPARTRRSSPSPSPTWSSTTSQAGRTRTRMPTSPTAHFPLRAPSSLSGCSPRTPSPPSRPRRSSPPSWTRTKTLRPSWRSAA